MSLVVDGGEDVPLLREELKALCERFTVPASLLRLHLAPRLARAPTPAALLASSTLLGALEVDRPWRALSTSIGSVFVASADDLTP